MPNNKGSKGQKRVDKNVYFYPEELELIKDLAKRTSLKEKTRPLSQVIRECVLAVARNPDLDILVFAPENTRQLTISELLLRQKLLKSMESNIKILKEHGVEIPEFGIDDNND